jgi:hypothetical protein
MPRHFFAIVLCSGLCAAGALHGQAREAAPAAEVFGGFSYVRTSGTDIHARGWEGSVTGSFNRLVGAEVDFNVYHGLIPDPPAYSDRYRLLFGPRFAYRGIRGVTPFAHVLIGVTRGRQIAPYFHLTGRTAFTAGFGGGMDVKVMRFLWLRPFQADYLRISYPNDLHNSVRLSFGLVFRFGRTK